MSNWLHCKIKDFFKIHYSGEWGNLSCGDENDFNVLRSTNFGPDGKIDYSNVVVRNIPKTKQLKTVLKKGDILLEKSGGGPTQPVGRVVLFCKDSKEYVCANFIQRMCLKEDFDSTFVLYKLMQIYYLGITSKHEQQTTGIRNLKLSKYLDEECLIPPLPQQRKIARILTTVDNLIEKTEALIAKYQSIKQGLMHDLFTRGVDANGKLRPPQSEVPELYKQSELGWIPMEWEVERLGVFTTIVRGSSPRPKGDPRYYGGSVPRLMVEDVTRDGKFVLPKVDFLTEAGAALSRPMPSGSLTLVCSGTVGIPAFLGVDACIHDGFLGFRRIGDSCLSDYLYYQFVLLKGQMDTIATHGGIFTNLTTGIVKDLQVALPPVSEQKKIAEMLSICEKRVEAEIIQLAKYKNLKTALMQDLLTGKVQVKPDEVDMEPAHE